MNPLRSCFMLLLSLMVASSERMVTKNIDVDDIRAKCPAPCTIYVAFCVSSVTELCSYERVDTFTWKREVPKRSIQLTFSYDATQERMLRIQVAQPKYSNLYMTKESQPLKQMNISLEQDTNTESDKDELKTRMAELEQKLEYALEELNNTKEELNSTKEELLKRNEESSKMNEKIIEQAEGLKSRIAHLEANAISKERFEWVEQAIPFKLPPNAKMIKTMKELKIYGLSTIISDKFGKYETINWNKMGGNLNWTERWMGMKRKSIFSGILSPPLLLPREYGECVVMLRNVWENNQWEIQEFIPFEASNLLSLPKSIIIDAQITISIDEQIIKRERRKFTLRQPGSVLFAVSKEMNPKWNLPSMDVQVFPLT